MEGMNFWLSTEKLVQMMEEGEVMNLIRVKWSDMIGIWNTFLVSGWKWNLVQLD